jgi:hypothetical protein
VCASRRPGRDQSIRVPHHLTLSQRWLTFWDRAPFCLRKPSHWANGENSWAENRNAYGFRWRERVGRCSSALASIPKAFASLSTMSMVALYSERSKALT